MSELMVKLKMGRRYVYISEWFEGENKIRCIEVIRKEGKFCEVLLNLV
jgi:hypothetical protein